jgi:hypothetical protein
MTSEEQEHSYYCNIIGSNGGCPIWSELRFKRDNKKAGHSYHSSFARYGWKPYCPTCAYSIPEEHVITRDKITFIGSEFKSMKRVVMEGRD